MALLCVFYVAYRRYLLRKVNLRRAKLKLTQSKQNKRGSGEALPGNSTQTALPDNSRKRLEKCVNVCQWFYLPVLFLAGLWFIWLPLLPLLACQRKL